MIQDEDLMLTLKRVRANDGGILIPNPTGGSLHHGDAAVCNEPVT